MPAPVIKGFLDYLSAPAQLDVPIWDGEIPRFNTDGDPITIPGSFPAMNVEMTEQGLTREGSSGEGRGWTFNTAYSDDGILVIHIMDTTRAAVQNLLNEIEILLCDPNNWPLILLPGGPTDNPFYVIECIWHTWTNRMMEGLRTQNSDYIYLGQVFVRVSIHGAVTTE